MRALYAFLIAIAVLWAMPRNAQAQLYVLDALSSSVFEYNVETGQGIPATGFPLIVALDGANGLAVSGDSLFVTNGFTVGKYDADSGFPDNPDLITGLGGARGVAVSDDNHFVFVAQHGSNTVGKWSANSRTFNTNFISGLNGPSALALLNNTLFVANSKSGQVGVYNATSGEVINASLIKGLNGPDGLAVSGNKLFVLSGVSNGTVGKYDANSGAAINASLISGLNNPAGLAVLGNTLFVAKFGSDEVGKYDATTGEAMNSDFISGLMPRAVAIKSAK